MTICFIGHTGTILESRNFINLVCYCSCESVADYSEMKHGLKADTVSRWPILYERQIEFRDVSWSPYVRQLYLQMYAKRVCEKNICFSSTFPISRLHTAANVQVTLPTLIFHYYTNQCFVELL